MEIVLLSHDDRWCHTLGIFPGLSLDCKPEILSLIWEDAYGMTGLIRVCTK